MTCVLVLKDKYEHWEITTVLRFSFTFTSKINFLNVLTAFLPPFREKMLSCTFLALIAYSKTLLPKQSFIKHFPVFPDKEKCIGQVYVITQCSYEIRSSWRCCPSYQDMAYLGSTEQDHRVPDHLPLCIFTANLRKVSPAQEITLLWKLLELERGR